MSFIFIAVMLFHFTIYTFTISSCLIIFFDNQCGQSEFGLAGRGSPIKYRARTGSRQCAVVCLAPERSVAGMEELRG